MAVMVEQRSYRPFKSSEEYLYAMKEDLAEWLNNLYPDLYINVNNFMDRLDTGVALCEHANNVRKYAEEYVSRRQAAGKTNVHSIATSALRLQPIRSFPGAKPGTFFARDNVSNFITWCRHGLGVFECLLFETDDLILRKNEKHVILCLLEVARRAAKLGMPAPMLVHLEREIDREIAAEKRKLRFGGCQDYYEEASDEESDLSDGDDCVEYGPIPQIVTNDLKSLDEMVRDEVEKCQCPTQFPMIRVSEGKYRIGDTKVLIFVRILRSHVMVRVGGGWDTLSHYLDKHDPCRCRTSHRAAVSSRITGIKSGGPALELAHAQVHYDRSPPRTRRSSTSSNSSNGGTTFIPTPTAATLKSNANRSTSNLSPAANNAERRSRSPTPRLKKLQTLAPDSRRAARSRSPTPNPPDRVRSRSGTPTSLKRKSERKDRSFVASNKDLTMHIAEDGSAICRSRSPSVGRRSRHNSTSSNKGAAVPESSDRVDEPTQNGLKNSHADELTKRLHEPLVNGSEEAKEDATDTAISAVTYGAGSVDCSHAIADTTNAIGQLCTAKAISVDAVTVCAPVVQQAAEVICERGIDTTPACRVSDNFVGTSQYHLLYTNPPKDSRRSVSPCRERSGIDTTPFAKISDNLSRPQYQTTMPVVQRAGTQVSAERSGVDTTPVSKVSENFVSTTSRSRKSSASVNDLDLITKKEPNDSGSEVSDEGYKSLGLVTTPPATAHQTTVPPLPGSPSRVVRPPRSRSAGGQDSPSPQQSPFRRNAKANQSARQSPTHLQAAAKHSPRAARNYNTWNSSAGKKKRPVITEDTFCQQVAEIMQQYAAMMPSPRKDSKPDSRISTRIPAPVPVQRT